MFNNIIKEVKGVIVNKSKSVLCVPGNWNNSDEIARELAKNNLSEFLFVLDLKNNISYEIENSNDFMKESFKMIIC